jgi:hypothetical protein
MYVCPYVPIIGILLDVEGNQGLSRAIKGYQGLSRAIKGYHGLSRAIEGYQRLFMAIMGYQGLSRAVGELFRNQNIEQLIKQSRPLVHNHVPALTCNGMIGPVLV